MRKTENYYIDPWLLLLTIPHCVIFKALQFCLFYFPTRGHQIPGNQSLWMTISKSKTPDWRLTPARLHVCYGLCMCNFTMPMYSSCLSHYMLLLIYTGASWNHIVYTAETSGSIKGQYAILLPTLVFKMSTCGNFHPSTSLSTPT